MGVQYLDTSEHSDDVFYLQTHSGEIPLNLVSWGLAEKEGKEWQYRGALVIVSRIFDDDLDSCHGIEVRQAMEEAFGLFLEKGGLKKNELTLKDWERFRKGEPKLKRRFLKRQLRNGCYVDVMDALGARNGAQICNWIYQQVVKTARCVDITLGEMYGGVPVTLEDEGERAHEYARELYNLFWNEKIMHERRDRTKVFSVDSLLNLQGGYRMSFSPNSKNRVNTVNHVIVSPEIEKMENMLGFGNSVPSLRGHDDDSRLYG